MWWSRLKGALKLARKLYRMERVSGGLAFQPRLWASGFLSQRAVLYPFDRFDRRLFLSDWEIEGGLANVNNDVAIAPLDDKLMFHSFVAGSRLRSNLPELIGCVTDGRLEALGQFPTIAAALAALGPCVAKPVRGWGGSGVRIVHTAADVPERGRFIVEARMAQSAYAATIFPGSLNTLRVVTMTDAAGEPFIVAAVHRFGCAAGAPVDNFKRSGIAALVELQSGQLSAGRSNPGAHRTSFHIDHPETSARIEGVVVPMWRELKQLALDLAQLFPDLHHVGWDLCTTPNGPRVIEGNAHLPNPNLIQAHEPFLCDARVRDFLLRHRVLSPRRWRQATAAAACR